MKMSPGLKKPKQGDLVQKPSGPKPKAPSVKPLTAGRPPEPPSERKQPVKNPNKTPMQTKPLPIPMPKAEGDTVRIEKIDNGFLSHHMTQGNGGEVKIRVRYHPQAVADKGSKEPTFKGKASSSPLKGSPGQKEIKASKKPE